MMCTRHATSTDLDDIVHRRRRLDHLPHPRQGEDVKGDARTRKHGYTRRLGVLEARAENHQRLAPW